MFDPTKPVQTREGLPARIICTDWKHPNSPNIALVTHPNGYETIITLTKEGSWSTEPHELDLVNIPVISTRYQGVYLHSNKLSWLSTDKSDFDDNSQINGVFTHTYHDGVRVKTEYESL